MKINCYIALSIFLIFSTVSSVCFSNAPVQESTKPDSSINVQRERVDSFKDQSNINKNKVNFSLIKERLKYIFYDYVLPLIKKIFGGVIDYTVASIIGNMIECRSSLYSDKKDLFSFLRSPCCQCNLNPNE